MQEENNINFTTQNALLHASGPINRQANRRSNSFLDRVGHRAAYAYGGAIAKASRAKDAIKNSKPVRAYNKYFDEAIDAEVARKQAKNRDPEQQEKINKMNSVNDETREQVRQVTSNLNEVEKYINAYKQGIESFSPSDTKKREKFADKFIEKYGSKIREKVEAANYGMDQLENSGLEGMTNNKIDFAIKGQKGSVVMANLENSVRANKDQIAKKSKNIVYGNYK